MSAADDPRQAAADAVIKAALRLAEHSRHSQAMFAGMTALEFPAEMNDLPELVEALQNACRRWRSSITATPAAAVPTATVH